MQTIKYVNHSGTEYILHGAGHTYVEINSLRAYDWSFEIASRPNGYGGVASSFARRPLTRDLSVSIRGTSEADFYARMNALHAVSEVDTVANIPGKLYIGSQYLTCYLAVGSTVEMYARKAYFVKKNLKVLIVDPYWCTDYVSSYKYAEAPIDPTGKKYNLRYPYRYGTNYGSVMLFNDHYTDCPAVFTFYGPCVSPAITINGNIYGVNLSVPDSTDIIVDQVRYRIFTQTSDGYQFNVFDARNKSYDIFKPIPPGASQILYAGSFDFDVTLIKQRSEPLWE